MVKCSMVCGDRGVHVCNLIVLIGSWCWLGCMNGDVDNSIISVDWLVDTNSTYRYF